MMYVYIYNQFHNTTARAHVHRVPAQLSDSQIARLRKQLCGLTGCECLSRGPGLKAWDASGRKLVVASDWSVEEA